MNWKEKVELAFILIAGGIATLLMIAVTLLPAYGLYLLLDKLIDKL